MLAVLSMAKNSERARGFPFTVREGGRLLSEGIIVRRYGDRGCVQTEPIHERLYYNDARIDSTTPLIYSCHMTS